MVAHDYLRELAGALESEPPDAFLVQLAPAIAEDLRFPHYETLVATGFPLWVAYRRGVGGPVGRLRGRAAAGRRPVRTRGPAPRGTGRQRRAGPLPATGERPRRRAVAPRLTSLPIGVYPNNGRYDMYTWRWEHTVSPGEMADDRPPLRRRGLRHRGRVLRDPTGAHRRHRQGGEAGVGRARARTVTGPASAEVRPVSAD